jgi:hypothetical protein
MSWYVKAYNAAETAEDAHGKARNRYRNGCKADDDDGGWSLRMELDGLGGRSWRTELEDGIEGRTWRTELKDGLGGRDE